MLEVNTEDTRQQYKKIFVLLNCTNFPFKLIFLVVSLWKIWFSEKVGPARKVGLGLVRADWLTNCVTGVCNPK